MGRIAEPAVPHNGPVARLASLLMGAFAAGLCACGGPDRPVDLVVLFTVDTLRADQLGPWGGPAGLTPNLDRLAAESLRFERAYSQSTVTHPSLASMFSGLLPSQHGVVQQTERFVEGLDSVPRQLQAQGIKTASFVANLCHLQPIEGSAFHDGWDVRFCGMLDDPENYRDQWEWDRLVVDEGLAWLASNRAPALVWMHLMDPHAEHRPPPHLWDWQTDPPRERSDQMRYLSEFVERRELPTAQEVERLWALYRAQVAGTDEQLGRVLEALEQHPARERAAVLFASDHGEELFETWAYHGHGLSPTDGVLHIPLLVRAPAVEPGVSTRPVELLQVAPTLLELFAVAPSHSFAGNSLLSTATGRGYALSQPPGLGTTLRTHEHRLWMRDVAPERERSNHPRGQLRRQRAEEIQKGAPWLQVPLLLASYGEATAKQPTFLDLDTEQARRIADRLSAEVLAVAQRFPTPGEHREAASDPALLRQLAELGYAGY